MRTIATTSQITIGAARSPAAFDHRSHYQSHEHNHPVIVHAHRTRSTGSERREHDEMAHTHDHARPTSSKHELAEAAGAASAPCGGAAAWYGACSLGRP